MTGQTIKYYSDYKSPYAFLAKDPVYRLEDELGVAVDWLPYTLDIPSYLGSAKVDDAGKVVDSERNAHQWRRVKYSYMDCRRSANLRGLTIRGPKKIFDSSLANIGLLLAKDQGIFRAYNDRVFERFWKRELDIEAPDVLASLISECGGDGDDLEAFLTGPGRQRLLEVQRDGEAHGVFGVPSFLLPDGDLYWGQEHLPRIRELLAAQ